MQTKFLCFSVLRVTLGPRVKWAGCKSALTTLHPGGCYSTDCSKAVVPCWSYSLLLCGLFNEAICFTFCLVFFCSCVFQSF